MPTQQTRPMSAREWAMLVALATVWGGSFFFNEIALQAIPVLTVVLARVALAALVLLVVMRARGMRMPTAAPVWAAFLAMGLLNNAIPFSLIVWGQQHIAAGAASILNAATPLFTVLLAHGLTHDERLTPGRLAGVVTGFAGVAVMVGPGALGGLDTSLAAQLACLAAALAYAFAGIFGRRFGVLGVSPIATATGQVIASSLLLAPLVAVVDRPWLLPMPGPPALASLVGLAVISTALAYVLYFRILSTAGATNLLLVTLLVPVSAIVLGAVFLGEVLTRRHVAGMALIGSGLLIIDGRVRVRRARTSR